MIKAIYDDGGCGCEAEKERHREIAYDFLNTFYEHNVNVWPHIWYSYPNNIFTCQFIPCLIHIVLSQQLYHYKQKS